MSVQRKALIPHPLHRLIYLWIIALLIAGCTKSTSTSTPTPILSTPTAAADTPEATATNSPEPDPPTPTSMPTPTPATAVSGTLNVYYLDVGQGDSTLLLGPDFTILIDAGRHNGSEVVPHLERLGVQAIDLLIGTHPHADHIGQMDKVLQRISVTEVWMSGGETTSQTFERVLDAILASDADYHEPKAGEVDQFGSARIEVVNPSHLMGDLNEDSVAVRIVFGDVVFLFTGDAEMQSEAAMLARGHDLRAHVLQLGHHGSRTSSTQAFLEAVQPDIAIWSAGQGNSYGHPHDEVLDRLAQMGIATYGTAEGGTIVVTSDGQSDAVLVNGVRAPPPVSDLPGDAPRTAQQASINSTANLRAGPSTDFEVVGSASAGTPITPLGRNEASDWIIIESTLGGQVWVALFLVDGVDLTALPVVPELPLTPTPAPEPDTPGPTSEPNLEQGACAPGQVDINTASHQELQRIHQIGPERADQILQLRPFSSVDDMVRIRGIASGRLAGIKAQGVACVN